jgi:fatty-acyl-CoA synthase
MNDDNLARNPANFSALTPLTFLERAAKVYPNKLAVIHGATRFTYRQFYERCRRLAYALCKRGIGPGDTVAVMAPNVPALLESHYGAPMAGAVLAAINYRLDAASIARMLTHGEAKLLIVDREYVPVVADAIKQLDSPVPIVEIDDGVGVMSLVGSTEYEAFLAEGDPEAGWSGPQDEWEPIALNYTSGTSGNPRGVVYHHRGAFLNALSNVILFGLNQGPTAVYLWTLPMFHCNGWAFTWGVTAVAGTHVCLRRVEPAAIFSVIAEHKVTHMCGAPIVLNLLVNAQETLRVDHIVQVATGGAAPPAAIIAGMEDMGFRVTHLYGLTESFGPAAICAWQEKWDDLSLPERAARMARQGVSNLVPVDNRVVDPETMTDVPADGRTMGELVLRGNTLMRGYLKNPAATSEAFAGGWFHTGDLAVRHPDGYIEIKDRSKDVIIVGGDNISSLEIEDVLYRHPQILEAAVVAKPDPIWGEVPCAFVTLKSNISISADDITDWCRANLADYKVPRTIIFGPLPKTATGKVQKFELRERLRDHAVRLSEPYGGGASPTKRQLAVLWERVLPVQSIGVTDNFFEIGGDSFRALRLCEEIERSFGRTLPLGVIFSLPTIEKLARFLDAGEEISTARSLVPLQTGGTGQPIFFVHWMLRGLVRPIGSDRPFYQLSLGLAAQTNHQRMDLPESMEILAAHYIEEMKTVQPHGPYTLVGYSAGGVVAFEMAQQLHDQGETVDFLGLIEAVVAKDYLFRGSRHPLPRQILNLFQLGPREIYHSLHRYITSPSQPDFADEATLNFWRSYVPKRYLGKVTLFKANGVLSVCHQRIPVERAWIELADQLEIHEVPGRHFSIMEYPHLRVLAAKLGACLA